MPIFWRYLLYHFFQVFSLSVCSFISILLVTRFQDIARFASTGAAKTFVCLFVCYQIPSILPMAIPISCLIASILLFQRLSKSHELTAFRSSGLGLFTIAFPLFFIGAILALLNFVIVSEIAPKCRALSKSLAYEMTATNPLSLLQKDTLVKLKNTYFDMKVLKSGKYAKDIIFIMRNLSNQRLGLLTAKELSLDGEYLTGQSVTFISSIDSKKAENFDHLVIENQVEMRTKTAELSQFLHPNNWNFNFDYLSIPMIRAKRVAEDGSAGHIPYKSYQEIARRFTLALAAFTFTLIGTTFGIEVGRNRSKTALFWALGLASLFMLCFLTAKSMKHATLAPILCYLLPHPFIILFCMRHFKKIAEGNG
ncbi:MAG TPA: LptF/LptG family permease [Rhabdochlamydiaceae bacterium]|nr:LptF/LptG family permease [Rhabdochlamydiaceae bacterium]